MVGVPMLKAERISRSGPKLSDAQTRNFEAIKYTTPPWSRPWASWSRSARTRTYATREEAALDLFEYIEVVYNRARMHSVLGYLSPAEFEGANWPAEEGRPKAA